MRPDILSTSGLVLDIAGVILLYKYGLPAEVRRSGIQLIGWGLDEEEIKEAKRYDRISLGAICLLVVGFGLQIVSTWL